MAAREVLPKELIDSLLGRIEDAFPPTLLEEAGTFTPTWPEADLDLAQALARNLAEDGDAVKVLRDLRLLTDKHRIAVTGLLMKADFGDLVDYGAPAQELFFLGDDVREWLSVYDRKQLDCISFYCLVGCYSGDLGSRELWCEVLWNLSAWVHDHADQWDCRKLAYMTLD